MTEQPLPPDAVEAVVVACHLERQNLVRSYNDDIYDISRKEIAEKLRKVAATLRAAEIDHIFIPYE